MNLDPGSHARFWPLWALDIHVVCKPKYRGNSHNIHKIKSCKKSKSKLTTALHLNQRIQTINICEARGRVLQEVWIFCTFSSCHVPCSYCSVAVKRPTMSTATPIKKGTYLARAAELQRCISPVPLQQQGDRHWVSLRAQCHLTLEFTWLRMFHA